MDEFVRVILLLLASFSLVSCKRYDIPVSWMELNLEDMVKASLPIDGVVGYVVLTNGTTEIVSENGTYALVLLGTNELLESRIDRRLKLAVLKRHSDGASLEASVVPVWTGDKLDMQFDGLSLDETGNLILYCKGNGINVWQSFDHPKDIMLPGQRLRYHKEVSRYDPSTGFVSTSAIVKGGMMIGSRSGQYLASLSPSGFALYANLYPYQVWSVRASEQQQTLASITKELCRGYQTVLHFTGSQLKLSYEATSSGYVKESCEMPTLTLMQAGDSNSLISPYLQLDSTGDLVIFSYDSVSRGWTPALKLSDSLESCKLPSACGDDRVYDRITQRCSNLKFTFQNDVYRVEGVNHFSTKFMTEELEVGIEECPRSSSYPYLWIYDNNIRKCLGISRNQRILESDHSFTSYEIFTTGFILGSRTFYADNTTKNLTAFFTSVPYGYEHRSGISKRAVILFIIVGCVAALWSLAIAAFLAVKYKVLKVVAASHTMPLLKRKLKGVAAFIKYTTINTMNYFNKSVQEMEALLSRMQGLPCRYSYMELENATKGFSTKLGAGGYGSVYEGMMQDGKHVAVKKLARIHSQPSAKTFITEVVGIGGISHWNVVKLYGFCMDGASKRLLVYEFMPNGSLDRWIFENERGKTLTWSQRLDIALGVARGLCYLHEECSEPILHLDVKPQNILLDENFVPKLCDFGVAKLLENRDITHATVTAPGTFAYMAPELLMRRVATKKCDVYSYGLVLLELIGGRRNTEWNRAGEGDEDSEVDSSWYFPSWAAEQVRKGNLIEIWDENVRNLAGENRNQAGAMVRLALWCLQSNPSVRPSFYDIVEVLEGRRMIGEPPMSFHFSIRESEENS